MVQFLQQSLKVLFPYSKRWYAERKDMQKMLKKAKEAENAAEIEYWDKRQLVKKINPNSLYGAILIQVVDFDKRIGQAQHLQVELLLNT